jgi:hypothetical protein
MCRSIGLQSSANIQYQVEYLRRLLTTPFCMSEKIDLETCDLLDHENDEESQRKVGKKRCVDLGSWCCHYIAVLSENLRCPMEPKISFLSAVFERTSWLAGLLILQSCSSFILEANINLMESHPAIIYFLTVVDIILLSNH